MLLCVEFRPIPAHYPQEDPLMSDQSLAARALSLALTGPALVTALSPLPPCLATKGPPKSRTPHTPSPRFSLFLEALKLAK
jgi:hypothetical protein